ncbi:MAG: head GIN domain-containing protein [Bacteroidota bacterium]
MKAIQWVLILFLQLGWLPGTAQKTINDPNAQVRPVGTFNAIVVSSSIDLFLTQSGTPAVAVSASDLKNRDQIITEVKNNTLYISFKSKGTDWGSKNLRAYVAATTLNRIEASGACDIKIEGSFKATDLEIVLSGSSDFKGDIIATNLKLNGSGSSDFLVSGSAKNLRVDISGASDVKGFDLITDYCDASASGASDINVTVNKELKVKASGASDVSYKGDAAVKEVSASGASGVKKKG